MANPDRDIWLRASFINGCAAQVRQRAGRLLRLGGRPLLLVCGLVAAGLAFRELGLDTGIEAAGRHGPAAFVLVGSLGCAVGVPRQVVAYAGGLAFGFWPGALLALLAETLGCAADVLWARMVAREWAGRWLARVGGGRLDRLNRFLSANAFSATLTLRLLPVGSNLLLNMLAGVSGVAFVPFLAGSVLGYVPQTVVFALLGGGVRVSQGLQVAVAAALFAVSIALGFWLLRRRAMPEQPVPEPQPLGRPMPEQQP